MQENTSIVLILAVALVVLAVGAWALWRVQRRRTLARKYGSEYERLARDKGTAERAIKELEERERRVGSFQLRELTPAQRDGHVSRWNGIQAAFVDEPARAAQEAHLLLADVMRDRGYPDTDLAQRQRDLSVNYPDLIEPYREACAIAARRGGAAAATTEDLRRATIVYRSLIDALLGDRKGGPSRARREVA
ncbi:MAG TPA: hypothetical protein VFQ51_08600 [Vicinamibacteria bacterium]|nr:hypothetical protein [Vicinamibacteria bacterium]